MAGVPSPLGLLARWSLGAARGTSLGGWVGFRPAFSALAAPEGSVEKAAGPTPPPKGAGPVKNGLDIFGRAYGTGRRKRSIARVWIKEGEGRFVINRREIYEYFQRLSYREKLVEPLVVTETVGQFDVWCTVKGGGTTGQVGAISLGLSRALESFNAANRPLLSKESLLTRDSRRVERKKPGQPKARKKDQWVKR